MGPGGWGQAVRGDVWPQGQSRGGLSMGRRGSYKALKPPSDVKVKPESSESTLVLSCLPLVLWAFQSSGIGLCKLQDALSSCSLMPRSNSVHSRAGTAKTERVVQEKRGHTR